eukprot:UN02394
MHGNVNKKDEMLQPKLKQLKNLMVEIYEAKMEYNRKCRSSRLPHETLECFCYRYLHQKFGLEDIVLQWGASIWDGVNKYSKCDPFIRAFGKILRNQLDEEFLDISQELEDAFEQLLLAHIKAKHPLKSTSQISAILGNIMNSSLSIDD